jgi:hypothetical protein
MRAQEILNRGIRETTFKDETLSYTGVRDFQEKQSEVMKLGPKGPIQRPRTKASQNNSYT